jgi:hypothetical protein
MPLRASKLALQGGTAAAMLLSLVALGHVPIGEPPRDATIRLAGRMVGEKVKVCRDLTPAELATIPKHMQAAGQRCDQSILPYRLQVWVDDAQRADLLVQPAGVRGDRPVYVHKELVLPPGAHRLRVQFDPEEAAPATAAGGNPSAHDAALREAVQQAARFPLERELQLRAGAIVLVELNEQTRKWEVHGAE